MIHALPPPDSYLDIAQLAAASPDNGVFVVKGVDAAPCSQFTADALHREGYATDDPCASMMQYKVDNKVVHTANVQPILLLRLIGAPAEQAHRTPG